MEQGSAYPFKTIPGTPQALKITFNPCFAPARTKQKLTTRSQRRALADSGWGVWVPGALGGAAAGGPWAQEESRARPWAGPHRLEARVSETRRLSPGLVGRRLPAGLFCHPGPAAVPAAVSAAVSAADEAWRPPQGPPGSRAGQLGSPPLLHREGRKLTQIYAFNQKEINGKETKWQHILLSVHLEKKLICSTCVRG